MEHLFWFCFVDVTFLVLPFFSMVRFCDLCGGPNFFSGKVLESNKLLVKKEPQKKADFFKILI